MHDANLDDVRRELRDLRRSLTRLEDIHSVRTLCFKYGYYIDKCLYDEVVDLFADDCVLRLLNGVWRGKQSIRRCYTGWMRQMFTQGVNGPVHGFLLDHFVAQDIVDISADGLTAHGRFRCLMQAGSHETRQHKAPPFDGQMWEGGISENVYVKEDGIWKIKENNYHMLWQADYTKGWAHSPVGANFLERTFPEDPFGPDELQACEPLWPHTRVVPFHYPHPVTSEPWSGSEPPSKEADDLARVSL